MGVERRSRRGRKPASQADWHLGRALAQEAIAQRGVEGDAVDDAHDGSSATSEVRSLDEIAARLGVIVANGAAEGGGRGVSVQTGTPRRRVSRATIGAHEKRFGAGACLA